MAADPRRIVSSMVEAKACHVTSLAECARRYCSSSSSSFYPLHLPPPPPPPPPP